MNGSTPAAAEEPRPSGKKRVAETPGQPLSPVSARAEGSDQ